MQPKKQNPQQQMIPPQINNTPINPALATTSQRLTFDNLLSKFEAEEESNEDIDSQLSDLSQIEVKPWQQIIAESPPIATTLPIVSKPLVIEIQHSSFLKEPEESKTIAPQHYQRKILNVIKLRDMPDKPSNPVIKPIIKQTLQVKKKQIELQSFQMPQLSNLPEKPIIKIVNKWEEFFGLLTQICDRQSIQCQICQLSQIQNKETQNTILLLYALKHQIFQLFNDSEVPQDIDQQLQVLDLLLTYLDQTLMVNESIMVCITLSEMINQMIFNLYLSQDIKQSKMMEWIFKSILNDKLQDICQKINYSRHIPSNCLLYEYEVIKTGLQLIPDGQTQFKHWHKEMLTSAHMLDKDQTTLQSLASHAEEYLLTQKGESQGQQLYKSIIYFESVKKKIINLLRGSGDSLAQVKKVLQQIERLIEDEQYNIKYGFTKLISEILQYRAVFTYSDICLIQLFTEQEQSDLWAEMSEKKWIQVIDENLKIALINYGFEEYLDYYKFNDQIQESVKRYLNTQRKGIPKALQQFIFNGEGTGFKGLCGYTSLPVKKDQDHEEMSIFLKKSDPICLIIKEIKNVINGELSQLQNQIVDSIILTQKGFKSQLNVFWNLKLKNNKKKLIKFEYLFQDQVYKSHFYKDLPMDKGGRNFQNAIDRFTCFFKEIQNIVLKVQCHLEYNEMKIQCIRRCIETIFQFKSESNPYAHALIDLMDNIQSNKLMGIVEEIEGELVSLIDTDIHKITDIFTLLLDKETLELNDALTLQMQIIYNKWTQVNDKKNYFINKINQIKTSLDILNKVTQIEFSSAQLCVLKNYFVGVWGEITNIGFKTIFKTYQLFLKDVSKNQNLEAQKSMMVNEIKQGVLVAFQKRFELKKFGEQILTFFSSLSGLQRLDGSMYLPTETDQQERDFIKENLQAEFEDVVNSLKYSEFVVNQIHNNLSQILIMINQNNYDQQYNFFEEIQEQIEPIVKKILQIPNLSDKDQRRNIQVVLKNHWSQYCREVETNTIHELYNQINEEVDILAYFQKVLSESQLITFSKIQKYNDEYSSELKPFMKQVTKILKSQLKELFNIKKMDFPYSKEQLSIDNASDSDDVEEYDEDDEQEEESQSESHESDQMEEKLKWFDDINEEKAKNLDLKQIFSEQDEWKLRERAVVVLFQIEQNNQKEEISKQVASLILQLRVKETDKRVLNNLYYKDNVNHLSQILQRIWPQDQEEFQIYINRQISDLQIYQERILLEPEEGRQKELIKHSRFFHNQLCQQLENIDQIDQLSNQGCDYNKTQQINMIKLEIRLEQIEEELAKNYEPEVKKSSKTPSVLELLSKRRGQVFKLQKEREFSTVTIELILKRFRNNCQIDEDYKFKLQNSFVHKLSKKFYKQKIGQLEFEQKVYENLYEGGLIDQFKNSDKANSMLIHGGSGSGKNVCLQQFEFQTWQKTCLTSKDIYWQLQRLYIGGNKTRKTLNKLKNLNINNILLILMESNYIDSKGFFLPQTYTLINDLFEAHLEELEVLLNAKAYGPNQDLQGSQLLQSSQHLRESSVFQDKPSQDHPSRFSPTQIEIIEKQFNSKLQTQRYGVIEQSQRSALNMIIFEEIVFQKITCGAIPIVINLQQAAQPQMNVISQSLSQDYGFQEGQAYKLQLMSQLGYIKILLLMKGYNNLPSYMQDLNIYDINQIQNWVNGRDYHFPKQIYFCETKFLDSEGYEKKFQAHINTSANDYKASESYWEYEIQPLHRFQLEDYLILNFSCNVKQSLYKFYKHQVDKEKGEISDSEKTIKNMFTNFWKQICKNKIIKQYFQEEDPETGLPPEKIDHQEDNNESPSKSAKKNSPKKKLIGDSPKNQTKEQSKETILRQKSRRMALSITQIETTDIKKQAQKSVFNEIFTHIVQQQLQIQKYKEIRVIAVELIIKMMKEESRNQHLLRICDAKSLQTLHDSLEQIWLPCQYIEVIERAHLSQLINNLFLVKVFIDSIAQLIQSFSNNESIKARFNQLFIQDCVLSDSKENIEQSVIMKIITYSGFFDKFQTTREQVQTNLEISNILDRDLWFRKLENQSKFYIISMVMQSLYSMDISKFHLYKMFLKNFIQKAVSDLHLKGIMAVQVKDVNKFLKKLCEKMSKQNMFFIDMNNFSEIYPKQDNWDKFFGESHEFPYASYLRKCIPLTVHGKQFQFQHKSIYEFVTAQQYYKAVKKLPIDTYAVEEIYNYYTKKQQIALSKSKIYNGQYLNDLEQNQQIKKVIKSQHQQFEELCSKTIHSKQEETFLQMLKNSEKDIKNIAINWKNRFKGQNKYLVCYYIDRIKNSFKIIEKIKKLQINQNPYLNSIKNELILSFLQDIIKKQRFSNNKFTDHLKTLVQLQNIDPSLRNVSINAIGIFVFCKYVFNKLYFKNLNLGGCNFYQSQFYNCQFENINFSEADLSCGYFFNCQFSNCNLQHSILKSSNLRDTTFNNCQLQNIVLGKSKYILYDSLLNGRKDSIKRLLMHPVYENIVIAIHEETIVFFDLQDDNNTYKIDNQESMSQIAILTGRLTTLKDYLLIACTLSTIKIYIIKIVDKKIVVEMVKRFNQSPLEEIYNLIFNMDQSHIILTCKHNGQFQTQVFKYTSDNHEIALHRNFIEQEKLSNHGYFVFDYIGPVNSLLIRYGYRDEEKKVISVSILNMKLADYLAIDMGKLKKIFRFDAYYDLSNIEFQVFCDVFVNLQGLMAVDNGIQEIRDGATKYELDLGIGVLLIKEKQGKVIDKFCVSADLGNKFGVPFVIKQSKANNLMLIGYQYGLIDKFSGAHQQSTEKQSESPNQVIKDIGISIININQFWLVWFLGTKPAQSKTKYNYKLQKYNIEYNSDHSIKNFQLLQQSHKHFFSVSESTGLRDNDIFHSELKIVQHPDLTSTFLLLYSAYDVTHSKFLVIISEVEHNLLAKGQGKEWSFNQESEIFRQKDSLDISNCQFSDVRGDPSKPDTFIMTMRSRAELKASNQMISKILIVNYRQNVVYKVINFDVQFFKQKINDQDMDFLYDQISNTVFSATEGLVQQWQTPADSAYSKIQEVNVTKRTLLNTIEPTSLATADELNCTDILGLHPTQQSVILYNIQELTIYQYSLASKKMTSKYQVEIETNSDDLIQGDSEVKDRKQHIINTVYTFSQKKKNYIQELMLDKVKNLALIKKDLKAQIQLVLHSYQPFVFVVLKSLKQVVVYNLDSEGFQRHYIQTPFNTQSYDNSSEPFYNDLHFAFHKSMPNIVLMVYQSSLQIIQIEMIASTPDTPFGGGSNFSSPLKLEKPYVAQTNFLISTVYFASFSQASLSCSGLRIQECEIDEDTKKKFQQNNATLVNCIVRDLDF